MSTSLDNNHPEPSFSPLKLWPILVIGLIVVSIMVYFVVLKPQLAFFQLEEFVEGLGGTVEIKEPEVFVSLKDTNTTDDDIIELVPKLQFLRQSAYLDLTGTGITDRCMLVLESLPYDLKQNIKFENTEVSQTAIDRLQRN